MKIKLLLIALLLLTACSYQTEKQPEENQDSDCEQLPVEEEEYLITNNQNQNLTFNLTIDQQEYIRKMINDSGVYKNYNPELEYLGVDFYRNTIGITAQAKDYPTLWITRYMDYRYGDNYVTYYIERFYRKAIDFTYTKDGNKRKATLEITWHHNPELTSSWLDGMVDCHLYVPNASDGNYNYLFYYDMMAHEIYIINDKGDKEKMSFAKDLEENVLEHCRLLMEELFDIDEAAQLLARDIMEYVLSVEGQQSDPE